MKKTGKSLKKLLKMILGNYKNEIYINLIKKEFDFLVQEYGFIMEEKISYEHSYDGTGTIMYHSDTLIIEIYKGRVDDLSVEIKPVSMLPEIKLHLGTIVEYRTNREFTMMRFQNSLSGKTEERLTFKIVQFSELLRKYCEPLLKGDFSWWPNVVEYAIDKSDKFLRALGVENYKRPE